MDEETQKALVKLVLDAYNVTLKPDLERIEKKVDDYRDELIGFKDDLIGKWKK